jgi:uncharacterized heparinase superfamily protein
MVKVMRFWRTARYLRPPQVYGRLWFQIARPLPDLSPAPAQRHRSGPWRAPVRRQASLSGPGVFQFLNEAGSLATHGWDDPALTKLWRYNQHYFDDLNAMGASARADWHRTMLTDWIVANPPGKGTGWEPYPTSLRIVNWIKWAMKGNALGPEARASLAVQVRWLSRRLEYHLLGNHLFANAKALIFAGLYFDGDEAQDWLECGLTILEREIPEQILRDGGQFELSPMYHALALEDMLDLVNIAHAYWRDGIVADWRARVPSMLRWLQAMSHPDDGIAFFNDSAIGIAADNAELLRYAGRLDFPAVESLAPLTHLESSGYVRMEAGPFTMFADLALIGPDYLPGHAHADTLSFELSYAGHRVFVNSGTSEYGTGPERLRQRGTAAHNTVIVDGRNSSEVWSGFRVGRRAMPQAISVGTDTARGLYAQATHDGYRHLPGRPLVSRRFELDESRLSIADTVNTSIRAEARFHLHPMVNVTSMVSNCAMLALPGGQQLRLQSESGSLRLEDSTWHPEFGVSVPNRCLVLPLEAGRAKLSVASI